MRSQSPNSLIGDQEGQRLRIVERCSCRSSAHKIGAAIFQLLRFTPEERYRGKLFLEAEQTAQPYKPINQPTERYLDLGSEP